MYFRNNCKKCRKEASKIRDKKKQFVKSNNKVEKMVVGEVWYSKEKIKCETCLLSQERERRRLLKHKNKRKFTEKQIELDSLLEPRKKRVKLSSLRSPVMDSSDDSIDYLRYTTAKIKNLKRKLLKKHKLKLQKKYQEQKQETGKFCFIIIFLKNLFIHFINFVIIKSYTEVQILALNIKTVTFTYKNYKNLFIF